jgi:protein involved in polysaccharide export with SLBB domain
VAKPGQFIYADNTTLEDIIMQAGGLLESASTVKVDISRRVKNPESMIETDTLSLNFSFELKDGFVIDGEPNFVLQPYDQVYVRRSPGYQEQRHVRVHGRILFAGNYALSSANERLSEVIKKAGGVTKDAYVKGARLSRIITMEDRMRMEATIDILNNTKDSIDISKFDLGDRYYVGINLEEVLANPGGEADIVLQEGDVIYIPEYQNTVKISGNVLYPNTVTYKEKMSVNDYIKMAGGYGFEAKKNRAFVVYMNGTVAKAKKNSRKVIEPGCEIIIPQKRQREGKLQEILSVATTSASIATMVASITNLVRN